MFGVDPNRMTGILLSATGRLNTLLNTVVDDVFSFLDSRGGEWFAIRFEPRMLHHNTNGRHQPSVLCYCRNIIRGENTKGASVK